MERCSAPVVKANSTVQNEMSRFQVSSRFVLFTSSLSSEAKLNSSIIWKGRMNDVELEDLVWQGKKKCMKDIYKKYYIKSQKRR